MDAYDDERIEDEGHANGSDPSANKKRKRSRNRAVLSCTNCKSRKIKCDRAQPCEGCIRRDIAGTCRWADAEIQPPPQVWTLDAVFESVRCHFEDRISKIERKLEMRPSGSSASVAHQARQISFSGKDNAKSVSAEPEVKMESLGDEAENAAMALEVLAVSSHAIVEEHPTPVKATKLDANFAYQSILMRDYVSPIPSPTKFPWQQNKTRTHLVNAFVQTVGSRRVCEALLDQYYTYAGWIVGHIHYPQLRREHSAFWNMVQSVDFDQVDPAWMALYCITLAQATQLLPSELPAESAIDLHELALFGLELADWRHRPAIRVVQAFHSMIFYHFNEGTHLAAQHCQMNALRTAQALKIHMLGSDPSVMPREDRSCPPGTLFAREMAVRIWSELVNLDSMASSLPGQYYYIIPQSYTTCQPRVLTDQDLEEGDYMMPSRPADKQLQGVFHLAKSKTAEVVRRIRDLGPPPPSSAEGFETYLSKLMVIDKQYREAFLNLSAGSYWTGVSMETMDWKAQIGLIGFHARLLRIHRPLMSRGYTDPRLEYSTKTCVESSREVLRVLKSLDESEAPISTTWFMHRHVTSAIIAIMLDVMHDIDIDAPSEVSAAKLVDLPSAISLSIKAEKSPLPSVVALSYALVSRADATHTDLFSPILAWKKVQALMDAEQARRRARGSGNGKAEEYASVLKRIADDVHRESTNTSPSSTTTPPVPPSNGPVASNPDWLNDPQTRDLLSSLGLLTAPSQETSFQYPFFPQNNELDELYNLGPTVWNFSADGLAQANEAALKIGEGF